jgi:hypothetical protein
MSTYFNFSNIYCIAIRFECSYCHQEVSSGYLQLHGADYAAKNNTESYICEDYDAICDNCEERYYFSVCVSNGEGYVDFDESDKIKNIRIDVISNEEYDHYHSEQFDAISANKHLFQTFKSSIDNLQKLNEIDLNSNELNSILKRQIYTGIVAAMETFLSDTMINITLSDKNLIRNFVESCPDFAKQKFELREIFIEYNKLHNTIRNVLLDTIYHDLRKVREMYRSTFKIEFPDIAEPIKCVLIRHDLVHRNGKSKDGVLLNIDTEQVSKSIKTINLFVTGIAERLKIV